MTKTQSGQISIFFATTILVLITFIAFVINIGVFVKAKINLQNAVDAAAYAGASVQARQLTNIAYLNWEMRNNYKEWLFKMYVLGNVNLKAVTDGAGNVSDLTMAPYNSNSAAGIGGAGTVYDNYNIPSVCIDFKASGNVATCAKAMVPGLPDFGSLGSMGTDQTTNAFLDALSASKNKDCTDRTKLNFLTSFMWAYNVLDKNGNSLNASSELAPKVATSRPGAYPMALELAMRMRSLEAEMNKAPYDKGVCLGGGGENCGQDINALVGSDKSPSNERIYKAFYSAFRNLGSSDCDDSPEGQDELKCSFTLFELSPTPVNFTGEFNASNILIPQGRRDKFYLDLKLMAINYASFFTMLAPNTSGRRNADGSYDSGEFNMNGIKATNLAECVSTKVGMPVPGFPLGFVKNPNLLTYYAVKGQTKFIGRFSPFSEPFTLTAFAAAKPFGGRVGPMLFDMLRNESAIYPRTGDAGGLNKSSPYASALDQSNLRDRFGEVFEAEVGYGPGIPIPLAAGGLAKFFVEDENDQIGGVAQNGMDIFFGIPNMVYDFPDTTPMAPDQYFTGDTAIQIINPADPLNVKAGLYNGQIYNKLRENLTSVGSSTLNPSDIENAVFKARAPTLYDAHHYLVPTPESYNEQHKVDSYGVIVDEDAPIEDRQSWVMSLYAPLISESPDALYKDPQALIRVAAEYLGRQEQAILKYRGAMNIAAWQVYKTNFSESTNANLATESSQQISNFESSYLSSNSVSDIVGLKPGCESINGSFVYFFIGKGAGGGEAVNLENCSSDDEFIRMLEKRWGDLENPLFYSERYVAPKDENLTKALFSAYRPTEMSDSNTEGVWTNYLTKSQSNMWRNYYSTKFVTVQSISGSDEAFYRNKNFAIMSEGNKAKSQVQSLSPKDILNYLKKTPEHDFSKIRH